MPGPVVPALTIAANVNGLEDPTAITYQPPPEGSSEAAAEPTVGSTVGPWLLRRLLGRGGMGAVFLAERTEQDFQQRAALKLIKLGMDSVEILRRFLAERRILARLEHPNIARLIDGGVDQRGRPYFVMEWVDGLPLTEYANAHGLDAAARVRLFLKLCNAVAHAHRQLVVHRDLKPGNILVDVRGEPKLLDFGIAKVLEIDNTEDTSATGPRFFTRAYAAPEQLRGEPVTTATDIYALGAVLFELLTGTPLHRARGNITLTREMLAQARRRAGSEGPAAVVPRMLTGDLALVAAMSVRDEPGRRYASVEAFANDLQACLDGRPVRARPDTASYRMSRFLQRHWMGVGASAAVLVAVVGGAGLAMGQAQIARREALRAEAVSDFLSRVFESAIPEGTTSGDITARSLIETGSERIKSELADQPEVRARLFATLGKAWFYIGDSARAAEMYEAGRALVSADDWRAQVELLRGLAQAELAIGQIRLARTHIDQALAQLDRNGPDIALERARTQVVAKSVHGAEGETATALTLAREAHASLAQLLGAHSEETLLALNDLGSWTLQSGDAKTALSIFEQVISLRREVSGPSHPETAIAMHNRVLALHGLGRREEALAAARTVVALRRQILPPLHRDLARSLGMQATIESSMGEWAAARVLRDEGIRTLRAQKRPDLLLLSQELTNQATDAFRAGDLVSAARDLSEVLERLQPMLGSHDARVLAASSYLGLVETYLGKLADAEIRLRAVSHQEQSQPESSLTQKLATRRYLARAIRWQGRAAEALEALAEPEAWLLEPTAQVSANTRARFHVEHALTLVAAGQLESAQGALDLAARAHGETAAATIDQAQLLMARARLQLARGDHAATRQFADEALQRLRQDFPETHSEVAEARALAAMGRWKLQPDDAARAAIAGALDWHQRERPWHPDTAQLRELLGIRPERGP